MPRAPQRQPAPDVPRDLLDELPTLIAYFDASHRVRWANLAFAHYTQRDREALEGLGPQVLFAPDAAQQIGDRLRRAFAGTLDAAESTVPVERNDVCLRARHIVDRDTHGTVRGVYCLIDEATGDAQASQRVAQHAAQERERLAEVLQLASSLAHLGAWEWQLETGAGSLTDEGLRIIGREPETWTFTLDAWMQLVLADDRALMLDSTQAAIEHGTPLSLEYRVLRLDGEVRWVRMEGGAPITAQGAGAWMRGMVQDITDRKIAEQAIHESEQRFRRIADASPYVVCITRLHDATVIYANTAASVWSGFPLESIIGAPARSFYADPAARDALMQEMHEAGAVDGREVRLTRADGTEAPMLLYLRPIEIAGEACLMTTALDLSAQREAERGRMTTRRQAAVALLNRESQVREHARLLEQLFTHSLDMMVVLDDRFNFVRVSDSYARGCAMDAEDLIGRNHFDVFPSDFEAEAQQVKAAKQPRSWSARPFEFSDHPEWGITYWNVGLAPILGADGEVELFIFTLSDVTQRVKTTQALTESETLFRELAENLEDVLWVSSADHSQILYQNAAYEVLTGRPREELYADGRAFLTAIHPDDHSRFASALTAAPGTRVNLEYRVVRPDGEVRWVRTRVVPVGDADGRVVKNVGIASDITELKAADRVSAEAQRHLRQIIDSLFGFVGLLDLQGTLIDANRAPLDAAGLSTGDVLGRPFWDTYWWSYDSAVQQRVRLALGRAAKGETVRYEETVRVLHGAFIDIDVSIGPLRDSSGAITSVIAFGVDVTDRKRVEAELRSAENRLSSFFAAAPVGLVMFDRQMRYTKLNPFLAALNGVPIEEHLGRLPTDVLGESARMIVDAAEHVATTKCPSLDIEFDGQTPGRPGERTCLDGLFFPFLGPHGELEGIGGVAIDVTAARLAQVALAEANIRLTEAQRIARLGHWTWDIASGALEWSDEVYRIFGRTPVDFIPTYESFLQTVHPGDRGAVDAAVNETRTAGPGHAYSIEHRVMRPDGTQRVVHEQGEAFFEDGVAVRMTGTIHDVTERHQAEQEVHRLNAELEQRVRERTKQLRAANAELEAFGYSISHDLRAPLRAINGFSQALEEDQASRLDDLGREHLARIRNAATRMGRLIDDLLALAHLSQAEVRSLPVDLTALAWEIVDELRQGSDRSARVTVEKTRTVHGDPELLRVLLHNLLDNAWKYTGNEAETEIEFGERLIDGVPTFFVRDNGAGFDMRYADRLFGVFQRLHHADEFPGTGIGLATVRRIARRHGGSTWAQSSPGAGATFYFRLGEDP